MPKSFRLKVSWSFGWTVCTLVVMVVRQSHATISAENAKELSSQSDLVVMVVCQSHATSSSENAQELLSQK